MKTDTNRLATEIAHILFMDLVAYSRLSMEEQTRQVRELRDLVRATPEFQRGQSQRQLIRLDFGDGMALVFFRDPVAPVQCAVEIAQSLRARPDMQLRMGVHSGPVSRFRDINGKENVSGGGINLAQRVMDCGDGGHILLSGSCAEVIGQFDAWKGTLIDLGETDVKHGVRLHLYNLVTPAAGNPVRPQRLKPAAARPPAAAVARKEEAGLHLAESANGQTVALLYKRNVPDDAHVLDVLERELKRQGFVVFVDRHIAIGVEWWTELERQIRGADAVIPLLSSASVRSEMLEYELLTAYEGAQARAGRPHILPVRVRFQDPLPESLAALLDPLQYCLWEGPESDEALCAAVIAGLHAPPVREKHRPLLRREPVGGAVPLDSIYYIARDTDNAFLEAVARQDSIVLVKGARQMGKTSLLARGLQQARGSGCRVVLTDMQTLNQSHLASADTFLQALAEMLADQLEIETLPAEVWASNRGPNMNIERYLRREVLRNDLPQVVWALDEVDRLFTTDFGSEIFGLFRSWHNRRALDPTGPWSRLTLAIAYATEAHLFITDMNQSPFNVGTRLTLEDFTFEQVAELNRRYRAPLASPEALLRFYRLVNGQPYLVRRGLDHLTADGLSLEEFEKVAARDEGPYGDHLRRILASVSAAPELQETTRGVLQGGPCPTPEAFYRLRSTGILAGDSAQECRFRCEIYSSYLGRHLAAAA